MPSPGLGETLNCWMPTLDLAHGSTTRTKCHQSLPIILKLPKASPNSLKCLLKIQPTWPQSASAGTVCVDSLQVSYLCTTCSVLQWESPRGDSGRNGRILPQDDGSFKPRNCSVHRSCLKVVFRADWNSHLESSCANCLSTFLGSNTVNCLVSSQFMVSPVQTIMWGVPGPPRDLMAWLRTQGQPRSPATSQLKDTLELHAHGSLGTSSMALTTYPKWFFSFFLFQKGVKAVYHA